MVLYGSASGAAPDISPSALLGLGSISLTRPTQMHYLQLPGMRAKASGDLFDVVSAGHVKIDIGQSYALKDASQAHADMEARKTTGSTVLLA